MTNISLNTYGKEKTEKMQEYLVKETSKLVDILGDDLEEIRAVVKVRNTGEEKTELNVYTKDGLFRKELTGESFYTTLSELCGNLENQIRDYKDKRKDLYIQRRRNKKETLQNIEPTQEDESFEQNFNEYMENLLNDVRIKEITPKPIFIEDAILEMEKTDHLFYLFVNAENSHPTVVYKRHAGGYGLLQMDYKVSSDN